MVDEELYGDVDIEVFATAVAARIGRGETNMAIVVLDMLEQARELTIHDPVQARQHMNRIKFVMLRSCPMLNPDLPPCATDEASVL